VELIVGSWELGIRQTLGIDVSLIALAVTGGIGSYKAVEVSPSPTT
jgi:hypothetical protein